MRILLAMMALSLASCASQGVNAYAYPDKIVVTQAMMDFVENDTELAFVFAHEFAHIMRGHVYRPRTMAREMEADLYALAFLRISGHDICLVAPLIARFIEMRPTAEFLPPRHEQAETQCKGG